MRFGLLSRRAPEPTELRVAHHGATFRIALRRRAAARRMTLRVSGATGDVVLTLPERADLGAAQRFAESQGGWIAARLAKAPERVALVAGAVAPLRGAPHRILHEPGRRGPTAAAETAHGPVIVVSGEPAHLPRRVRDFLQREAKRDLEAAVRRHCAALGLVPKAITIRDTRSRWGSCSASGRLSFSWRLILAPSFVLDYLAAHEAAHLRELNHSARFWRLVGELCPRTEEAERWLKRHGPELHRYG